MPAWETRKGRQEEASKLELPAPESPVWLPNLSAPRGYTPPGMLSTQHAWRGSQGHSKPLSPHSLTSQSLAGLQQQQQLHQTAGQMTGKFAMPKARDIPTAHLTRSPRDASGLFSMSTLPTVEVPGIRHRRPKKGSNIACEAPGAGHQPLREGSEDLEHEYSGEVPETEHLGPVPVEDANYDPDLIPGIETGEDVIEFYGKNGQDSAVKFFYCNRAKESTRFRPYDLVVVPRQRVDSEYFTMSATGVMRIKRGVQAEFTTLAEWVREKTLFDLISKIRFFKNYLPERSFRRWHKGVRQKHFRNVRQKVEDNLFLVKPTFSSHALEILAAACELKNVSFTSYNPTHLYTLQEWADLQTSTREQKARPMLESIVEKIQHVLEHVCRDVQKQAQLYQESVRDQAELDDTNGVELVQGRAAGRGRSMIAVKHEKLERARNFARVMKELTMLGRFIRLADYLFVEVEDVLILFGEGPRAYTFRDVRSQVNANIMDAYKEAQEYVKIFEDYRKIYNFGRTWSFEEYTSKPKTLREIRTDMHKQRVWRNELDRMKISHVVGCLFIDSKTLRNDLMPTTTNTLDMIKGLLMDMSRDTCLEVLGDIQRRVSMLKQRPTALDEFMAYQVMHQEQVDDKKKVMASASNVDDMYDMLAAYEHKVKAEESIKHDECRDAALTFVQELTNGKEFIADNKNSQMEALQSNIASITQELRDITSSLYQGDNVNPDADPEATAADLEQLLQHVRELRAACDTFREYQRLFEMEEDSFEVAAQTEQETESRYQLWNSLNEFMEKSQEWTESPILDEDNNVELSIDRVRSEVEDYALRAYTMGKKNPDDPVVSRFKDCIDDFKQIMPMVEELANPALKKRHWDEIFRIIEADIPMNEAGTGYSSFSVRMLLQYSVLDTLEGILDKMAKDWEGVEFIVLEYKDTGTYIMTGSDEVQALLDDQIVKAQAMRASPFIKPLEERALKWEDLLVSLQDLLDNWLACQATWQYLEPIFSSPDILKQMPVEGEKFQIVDQSWRDLMEAVSANPSALAVGADKERLSSLQECNRMLEEIQKGLSAYLEVKRIAFPRFFFLSNDEMLEILSETKAGVELYFEASLTYCL
ncbi:dynein heavy chain, N-terminal region 2-domain-containing protein [Dunaliella salina]|uniref:Dynein heavy chain, N-terminal region 2-domain-containing protein n=1 Tax=Dunaliella salina TaxID=3046 RepID=A0ABQ7GWK6_DUNSA|nr:dynein heavy chain, N-terminal region 2-domain-containing protein [Dunaliella salina]|eukprot:KAF5838995.1 dynein heavy chain, N-terminal region 2-domain-containing protein [Dunaliella salina]